jgi:hypothetical protein
MHPEYLPTTEEGKLDHILEEATEVINIIMKIKRFGPFSYHPKDENKTSNLDLLQGEVNDLALSFEAYRKAVI